MEFEIFADETYIPNQNGKGYLGIGCLFIPVTYKYRLSKKLSNLRCLNENSQKWTWNYEDCNNLCKEEYHNINNFEIHSNKIENNMSKFKFKIYQRWIKFVVNHNKHSSEKIQQIFIIVFSEQ